jgi:hypothetical protein
MPRVCAAKLRSFKERRWPLKRRRANEGCSGAARAAGRGITGVALIGLGLKKLASEER